MDEALVLDNLGLARMVAHNYRNTGVEFEDLEQTARIGLIKAAKAYDPSRGVKFSTYAVPVINNEMNMMLRKMRKNVIAIPLETEIVPGEDITIADTLVAAEDVEAEILAKELVQVFCSFLMSLPVKHRIIMSRRILFHEGQAAIAKSVGTSQPQVSRVIRSNLDKFKKLLSEGGYCMEVFRIGEEPVEIVPGIWLSYVDGVLHVEKEERR